MPLFDPFRTKLSATQPMRVVTEMLQAPRLLLARFNARCCPLSVPCGLTARRRADVVNLARFTQRRGDIKSVVRQVRASDIKTKAAVDPLLDKPLSWQVHTDKGWVEYQADVADAISVAHARKLPTVGITVSPAHSYVVDLGKMTQTPVNGGKSRKIRGPFST